MDPISALTALAPLVIDWAKERRKNGEDASESAFRAWFQEEAVPELLNATTLTFEKLSISQKAHHAELLDVLSKHFAEIKVALGDLPRTTTLQERWATLQPEGHALLAQLVGNVAEGADSYEDAHLTEPLAVDGSSRESVVAARKRLAEAKLANYVEFSGCAYLRLTGLGYLVVECMRDPPAFQAQLVRIQGALRASKGSAPVDKLAALSMKRCPTALLFAVVERWDQLGWLNLQPLDQRVHSRIISTTQQVFDRSAEELVRGTLDAFVEPQ